MKKFLPEICTIQYGFPFDSAKFSTSEGMPLIRIRDVVRGYSETFTTEKYKEEYIVNKDDLLIGMDGEFNIAKWGETPALLNQRVCRLLPTSEVDKNYWCTVTQKKEWHRFGAHDSKITLVLTVLPPIE